MSISVNGQTPSGHAHRHHRSDTASAATEAKTAAAATTTASPSPAATATASDPTGIQSFASELQSFLLGLQSGQAASSTATTEAGNAAAPAGPPPDGAPTAGGTITSVAEQLQHLLQNVTGAASTTNPQPASNTATTTDPNSLQSVLDKLQSTLSQALQSYQTTDAPGASTNLVS